MYDSAKFRVCKQTHVIHVILAVEVIVTPVRYLPELTVPVEELVQGCKVGDTK